MSNQIKQITSIYDLKGSLHRRDTRKIKNSRTVRKDLNFLRDTDNIVKMSLSQREDFKKRLYKDKEFLKSCNLMDYSLLLITFKKEQQKGIDDSQSSLFRMMTMKRTGGSPPAFKNIIVNQSLDNCNLKKIKEFDPLAEISSDEKRATSPLKTRIMLECCDLEAKPKIPDEPRFDSNPRELDQDV